MSLHIEVDVSVGTQIAKCKIDVPVSAIGVTGNSAMDEEIIAQFQARAIKNIIAINTSLASLTLNPAIEKHSSGTTIKTNTDLEATPTTQAQQSTICSICNEELQCCRTTCSRRHDSPFCGGCSTAVGVCMHTFHDECIVRWLHKSLDCPHGNCEDEWKLKWYTLSVIASDDQVFELTLMSSQGVIAVKKHVREQTGTLVKRQRLFLEEEELSDCKGAYDAGLEDGTVLRLEYT